MLNFRYWPLILVLLFSLSSCSPDNNSSETRSFDQLQSNERTLTLIIFQQGEDQISAFKVLAGIEQSSFYMESKPVFQFSSTNIGHSRIFPLYMSEQALILREAPMSSTYPNYKIAEANKLYFEEYVFTFDTKTFTGRLYQNETFICDISLSHNDVNLLPKSFFITDDGTMAMICMTSATLTNTEMVTLWYSGIEHDPELEKYQEYPSIWEDFNLSKVNCPSGNANVMASAANREFLYNEGRNLIAISPYRGTAQSIVNETRIKADLPFLDTHRESYNFFYGFSYQQGYYMATFPDYNNVPGVYAVLYDLNGEYCGGFLCAEKCVIRLDKNNNELNRFECDKLVPKIYLPL